MPTRPLPITNVRFGRLIVIRPVGKDAHRNIRWLCQCDCGNHHVVAAIELRRGKVVSCGCARKGVNSTHGHAKYGKISPEYRAWRGMHTRCKNQNVKEYKYYGGRGIKIDPRWNAFENFLADVGLRPHSGLSLDRINNEGNYEPGNVRWATRSEQRRNRRPWLKHIAKGKLCPA
jgi:hypothetical protein